MKKIKDCFNKIGGWFKSLPAKIKLMGEWFKKTPDRLKSFFEYMKKIPAKVKDLPQKIKNYPYNKLPEKAKIKFTSDGAIKLYCSLGCVLISLIIGLIMLIAIDPVNAFPEFLNLIAGGMTFGSTSFFAILANAAPLLCCGLSIVFANKTGMFNIGVAGQYVIGIFGTLLFALQFNCPWYVCLFMAMVFGSVWGMIPGLLKAHFNVSEVLSGIMLNWIALFFTNYSFQTYLSSCVNIRDGSKTFKLAEANPSALLPDWNLKSATGGYFTISIFIAIIAALIVAFIIKKTTLGYQLKASGLNKDATRYAGIKDKRNIVISLAISGALAGLGASLFYLADLEQYSVQASSSLPQLPWNGIVVGFLGQLSPIGTIFATLFTALITQGSRFMLQQSFPAEIANIITGIIVYGSGLTTFLIYIVNKYWFKNKVVVNEDSNQTASIQNQEVIVSSDSNAICENVANKENIDDKEGGR